MIMKIVTYVVSALLVAALGAGTFFYLTKYTPMANEYARMKAGMPELDRAKAELKKYKEKEKQDSAWLAPAGEALREGLSSEIKDGKAEVLVAGNMVVVNIAENALYLPGSYTFSKDSTPLRLKLITLLRKSELKGRNFYVGNTTQAVPASGRGRKRTPAKDARTLAAERSKELVKDFEKNGVDQDALVTAAFSDKQPELGNQIKARKTIIMIETPPMASMKQEPAKEAAAKASPNAQPVPKGIPIQPAQPKAQ